MSSNPRLDGASQSIYNSTTLKWYDAGVLGLSNGYIWRCPTPLMEQRYCDLAERRHLDVGPGNGHYLAYLPTRTRELTLVDANPQSLEVARAIVSAHRDIDRIVTLNQRADQPIDGEFDSASANYLFHCIEGDGKWDAVARIASALTPTGVFFGATIIRPESDRLLLDAPGRLLSALYNRVGVFANARDSIDVLSANLDHHFQDWTVTRRGWVALFEARRPHRPSN